MAIEAALPRRAGAAVAGLTCGLVWPALWNGYPIVFADTGTYLSQAVHGYLGWDRPPFYSLAILPLHLTITTWPVVIAQALLTGWILTLAWRVLAPGRPAWWLLLGTPALCLGTWLPWLASELMPDVFTPLLVLTFCLLAFARDRMERTERAVLMALAALMIAMQHSSLALWIGLFAGVLTAVIARLARPEGTHPRVGPLMIPPAVAVLALCLVNLAGHGRFAPSPFGQVFLLARLIADGPAVMTLRRHCPDAGWRLCPFTDALPGDSDVFLWSADSPLRRAGGHKAIAPEAGMIVALTLRDHPTQVAATALRNAAEQLVRTRSGDGLGSWPAEVAPWIGADFPSAETGRFHAARQQRGVLDVPDWLNALHQCVCIAGIPLAFVLLLRARREVGPRAGFLAIALLALPLSAAITGVLSAPHDRYQARVAFLPALVAVFCLPGPARRPA